MREVSVLIRLLRHWRAPMRHRAAAELVRHGSDAAPELLAVLIRGTYYTPHARALAAWALGEIGDERAVPALAAGLYHWSPDVRARCTEALIRFGATAVEELRPVLYSHRPVGPHRNLAAFALGSIGPSALPVLCEAMTCTDWEVRRNAAIALGRSGVPEAVPFLGAALRDSNVWVRVRAAEALSRLAFPAVAPYLRLTLAGPQRDLDARVRVHAAVGLGRAGGWAEVPCLADALRDPAAPVRWRAAEALARIARPEAIPALCIVLTDPFEMVTLEAARALRRIADIHPVQELRLAVPTLERQLAPWSLVSDEIRLAFRATLRRIETATGDVKDVPIPAAPPAPTPQELPLPAGSPSGPPEFLPLPSQWRSTSPGPGAPP